MTEAEAIAAAERENANSKAPCELESTAELMGPDYSNNTTRRKRVGHWIVGIKGSHSYYTVDDATGKVSFALVLGVH